ncbi:MAG: tetratricopeptide repeat protein [Planctomycetes bacterium]|nr:tetratricopeptide repeat protein [Planctomycetota bacterium]
MPTPTERREALALSLVSKGAGTHVLTACEGVHDAVVAFVAGELGAVVITLRADGSPVAEYRFNIAPPEPAAPEPPPSPAPAPEEKPEEALPRLRQATVDRPEDASAWHDLGSALIAAKKHEEAVAALTRAVELAPGALYSRFDLGLAHGCLGRHRDAEKWFVGIVDLDPGLEHAHSHIGVASLQNLAIARSRQGRAQAALDTLEAAAPLAWNVLKRLGEYAMDAGRHGEALNYFFAAVSFGPPDAFLLHGLGRSLLRVGRNGDAETWLRAAIRTGKTGADAAYDLGLALARQGKRPEARRAFRAALKADPRHFWSWYDLGCLDALDRKPDAAFRKLHRAARLGLNNVAHATADRDLASLRRDPRWRALVAAMRQATPAEAS